MMLRPHLVATRNPHFSGVASRGPQSPFPGTSIANWARFKLLAGLAGRVSPAIRFFSQSSPRLFPLPLPSSSCSRARRLPSVRKSPVSVSPFLHAMPMATANTTYACLVLSTRLAIHPCQPQHLPFAFPGKNRAAFGIKLSLFLISGFSIPFAAAAYQL